MSATAPPVESCMDRVRWIVDNDELCRGNWTRFADETGIDRDTIHSWRYHDVRSPQKRQLEKIAVGLGYRLAWLRSGREPRRAGWTEGRIALIPEIATYAAEQARAGVSPVALLELIAALAAHAHQSAELPGDSTPPDAIASTTDHGTGMIWRAYREGNTISVKRSRGRTP